MTLVGTEFLSVNAALRCSLTAAAMFVAASPALAHHSRAMFDVSKNVMFRGVVKEYRWQNPHSHIVVIVGPEAADPATVGTWDIEASATGLMSTRGWTRTTYKRGDPIEVVVLSLIHI